MFAFVLAAALTTYATGVLLLFVLVEVGATGSHHRAPGAAIDLALGGLLIMLAVRLQRTRPDPRRDSTDPRQDSTDPRQDSIVKSGPSKIDRYLHSRPLAFVLGVTLYILPSPIYIAAVKAVADAKLSTSGELLALAATVAVMLWMVELPMLILLIVPHRAERALDQTNRWFARNGRTAAIVASVGAGGYLAIKGLVDLIS